MEMMCFCGRKMPLASYGHHYTLCAAAQAATAKKAQATPKKKAPTK